MVPGGFDRRSHFHGPRVRGWQHNFEHDDESRQRYPAQQPGISESWFHWHLLAALPGTQRSSNCRRQSNFLSRFGTSAADTKSTPDTQAVDGHLRKHYCDSSVRSAVLAGRRAGENNLEGSDDLSPRKTGTIWEDVQALQIPLHVCKQRQQDPSGVHHAGHQGRASGERAERHKVGLQNDDGPTYYALWRVSTSDESGRAAAIL